MTSTARKVALGLASTTLIAGAAYAATPAGAGRTPVRPTLDRHAQGQVDEYAGARRENGDQTDVIRRSLDSSRAKNVILIIGDGMGDSEITVARNYLEGAGGSFKGIDALPLTGQMTHYSVYKDSGLPDYTPDSAATGTAWATGVKTYDNAIGVDRHGKPFTSLLELAGKAKLATGDITTSEVQDATPAVEIAHISQRSCYGPVATSAKCPEAALENGGLGSISEQLLNTRPDVTIAGGSKTFAETATAGTWKGKTLEEQARERGFQYVTDKAGLAGVTAANPAHPLLALVSPGNMPVQFAPALATKGGGDAAAQTCTASPDFTAVPRLGTMTDKAIGLLKSSPRGAQNGFFLQIESASIDKKDHAADACGQIGETGQLDEAVQRALDFAKRDKNTLVIVTADHAHSSQIVDGSTPGLSIKLHTNDGSDMIVAYGTAEAGGSQQHTGTQVRVAGYGPRAGNLVGLIDQTDLHFIIKQALGL